MHETRDDPAGAAVADEHAEIIALMTSDAWKRRLAEARIARDRVILQRNRTAPVRVFRRTADQGADRPARRDLLPPLEPAESRTGRPKTGVVIRLVPRAPFAFTALPNEAPANAAPQKIDRFAILWLASGLGLGALMGAVLRGFL